MTAGRCPALRMTPFQGYSWQHDAKWGTLYPGVKTNAYYRDYHWNHNTLYPPPFPGASSATWIGPDGVRAGELYQDFGGGEPDQNNLAFNTRVLLL